MQNVYQSTVTTESLNDEDTAAFNKAQRQGWIIFFLFSTISLIFLTALIRSILLYQSDDEQRYFILFFAIMSFAFLILSITTYFLHKWFINKINKTKTISVARGIITDIKFYGMSLHLMIGGASYRVSPFYKEAFERGMLIEYRYFIWASGPTKITRIEDKLYDPAKAKRVAIERSDRGKRLYKSDMKYLYGENITVTGSPQTYKQVLVQHWVAVIFVPIIMLCIVLYAYFRGKGIF